MSRVKRVRAAAREWWEFLKPPPIAATPLPGSGCERAADPLDPGEALVDVEVIHSDLPIAGRRSPIAEFQVSGIEQVPDEIEIAGRRYRATVQVGPFCRSAERPLFLLLVEPVDRA
jgi:hypothetical protein